MGGGLLGVQNSSGPPKPKIWLPRFRIVPIRNRPNPSLSHGAEHRRRLEGKEFGDKPGKTGGLIGLQSQGGRQRGIRLLDVEYARSDRVLRSGSWWIRPESRRQDKDSGFRRATSSFHPTHGVGKVMGIESRDISGHSPPSHHHPVRQGSHDAARTGRQGENSGLRKLSSKG